ncbi:hypothetical protein EIN_335190 [Entamoeba invadens IP1]|uniref:Sphingomyelin synthase-like domain-containing protein n=2 Tax=Entamoeba invadens TaxID=33085 RepID=L7FLF9_ENTIV|nr:hypothetical protein EIN_335190 [Entamoeba invadens IP1]ELP88547.1 hypothetical protein EIN_335190 [Entamoeba invadens IP1]BAN41901.1 hypothetical protein [Entamoeba invadens]|eukprot:XP_004255318.1 hypothetical protein EIN_335190 [Entamoeba invadens IP1]
MSREILIEISDPTVPPAGLAIFKTTCIDIGATYSSFKEFKKFLPVLFSIFWFICCGYWNSVFQVFAQERYTKWLSMNPDIPRDLILPDFFFKILPHLKQSWICDVYIGSYIVFSNFRFLFSKYRSCIVKRYFLLNGVLFLMRSFSIFFTIMPDPSLSQSDIKYNPFIEGFYLMFGIHKTTYDCMFSGHTASIMLCTLMWHHYAGVVPILDVDVCGKCRKMVSKTGYPLGVSLTSLFAWVYFLFGVLLFCMTHLHYFVDIYIGGVVTFLLFKMYNNYVTTMYTRDNAFNSFLRWFEQGAFDVTDVVGEQLDDELI